MRCINMQGVYVKEVNYTGVEKNYFRPQGTKHFRQYLMFCVIPKNIISVNEFRRC